MTQGPEYYNRIYQLIEARANIPAHISDVLLGLAWSSVTLQCDDSRALSTGLAFSPAQAPRNLPWPGTLTEKSIADILSWLHGWDNSQLVVALAAANAAISLNNVLLTKAEPVTCHRPFDIPANLAVFAHFAEQLHGADVAIIGRYPGIEYFDKQFSYTCIERTPQGRDLPDAAANYILPQADWVFITASSLTNKTLPHLLWLARNATVVLMGPSMPWLAEWADFGVDYLAGVQVEDPALLHTIISQGGGTKIFDGAAPYRVIRL